MAGRGPAPKANRTRSTDQKRREAEQTTVVDDGEARGPELPPAFDWPERTREWWGTWRRSPQAQTFTATDWDFLLDTAVLHAEYWGGNLSVGAELRLRVAKYGATPEDRARLKLQVETPAAPAAAAPKPAARKATSARRSRLLSVVDGSAS